MTYEWPPKMGAIFLFKDSSKIFSIRIKGETFYGKEKS